MNKVYSIFLDGELIGTTRLEKADAPMGVVFGLIDFINVVNPYDFFKSYCKQNNVEFEDHPDEKVISTRTIESLKVMNEKGQEIKGLGNQIFVMDSESNELTIEGIYYPFYGEEFPHHVKDYNERFN